MRMGIEFV